MIVGTRICNDFWKVTRIGTGITRADPERYVWYAIIFFWGFVCGMLVFG
jgi:hypothetical protein